MTLRAIFVGLAVLAPVLLLPAAASAFSMTGPDGSSANAVPKFDIEEHTRQFRTGEGTSNTGAAIREFQPPLGKSTVQFGVNNGPMFGSGFGSSGFRAQEDRRHMDRMLSAPGLQHRYDQ